MTTPRLLWASAAVSLALLLSDWAVACPIPKFCSEPIEAHDLRLEISSLGKMPLEPKDITVDYSSVHIMLQNRSTLTRSIPELWATGNRIDRAAGLTFILWFPDGTVTELDGNWHLGDNPWNSKKDVKPLTLPGDGYSLGKVRLGKGTTNENFWHPFNKNKGRFCLCAVVGSLGLQSNGIAYNGCPPPPKKFVFWRQSKNSPEKVKERLEKERLRIEEIKRREADRLRQPPGHELPLRRP